MDYKDFHDGLLSIASLLLIFSFTFMISSIILKPYIALEPNDRDFILILCSINLLFGIYYISEALRLDRIFILEEIHISKFARRIGIISLVFLPVIFTFFSLLFRELHNLQLLMVFLIIFMQLLLIGVILKEVYDLLFQEEAEKKMELEKNRKLYLEKD